MSMIYNQVYYVPVWVVLRLSAADEAQAPKLKALQSYLAGNGALNQPWPSDTFAQTIKKLQGRGWSHAVKPLPFVVDSHFITVAAAEHVREFFGGNKTLNLGSGSKPWHHVVSRRVEVPADYARILDGILMLQDPITLSHLFDVAEKCHSEGLRTYVYYTTGAPATTLLRSIAKNVIVVGDEGDVSVKDLTPEQAVEVLDRVLETAIRQ